MEWKVTNALNRDVERQNLNKILAEIRAAIDSRVVNPTTSSNSIEDTVGAMVDGNVETGIKVTYDYAKKVLDFAVSDFTIRLAGDVTGSARVTNLGSVVIDTVLNASLTGVEEAPIDNSYYWRWNGEWAEVDQGLASFAELRGTGFAAQHQDVDEGETVWELREFEVEPGELVVTNPAGEDGNPLFGLADLTDTGVGTSPIQLFTRDAKGRVEGTEDADTDDLPEGVTNLYFTDERAQDAVGAILTDTADVELDYVDGTPSLSATLTAAIHASLALADSAVQPGDNVSDLVNDAGYLTTAVLSVVAGTNVTIDNTDPENPIINAAGGGGGSGTVTSVDVIGGVGLDDSGGPVTTSGTITLDLDAATQASLALADTSTQPGDNVSTLTNDAGYVTSSGVTSVSGTAPIVSSGGAIPAISITAATSGAAGSMSAADKAKLDAISGTNTGDQTLASLGAQAADATLTALAGANWVLNNIPVGTGADTVAQMAFGANTFPARSSSGNLAAKTITDFGLSLVDDVDASAARTTLALGTLATQSGTFSGTSSGTNTGDQTITLTGNVTGSGTGSFAATIANSAVTLAKMADVSTSTVFYRKTAGTGAPEVQTLATLKSDLGLTGTNSGDQTLAGLGGVATTRTINTTAPLTGGGDLSADRTLAISAASGSTAGSMSSADFTKLAGIASGATAYTDSLARSAVVIDSIADSDTTHAPSRNAVFDALALKQDASTVQSLAKGGTGSALVDPNADRLMFWDDSAGVVDWLTLGTNLSITGTTINASGGGGSGTVTSVDLTSTTGLTASGGPVTTSGSLVYTLSANLQAWHALAPSSKQDADSDLTDIAALSPSNDDIIQRKAGAWTNRTMAQLKSDLSLSKSDVGLSNVDNTADTAKPVSTLQASADAAVQAYAIQRANHTGTQSADTLTDGTTNKAFLATERTKLSGIATGATANSSDATLLARANHTGTQTMSTISDLPVLASGTYTPTLFNTTNIAASTANAAQYLRVGDVVTVSGQVSIDPTTASTASVLGISLPIASNFSSAIQCSGAAACNAIAGLCGAVQGDSTNDRAIIQWMGNTDIANRVWTYTFTYRII